MGDRMNLLQVFSSNLYRYRKQRGFTQAQLADSAGLHRTYISAVERGKRNISIDNIEKVALTLKVDA
jgi:transcriptional regulator with XRE-family HTH domain